MSIQMKLIKIIILIICFTSCKHYEDYKFNEKFNNNIKIIERLYNYEDSIHKLGLDTCIEYEYDLEYYKGVKEAIAYNEVVTKISMNYNLEGGGYFYESPIITINKWEKWYNENKYQITLKKGDSIYFEKIEAPLIALEIMIKEGSFYSEERIGFLEDSIRNQFRDNYYTN